MIHMVSVSNRRVKIQSNKFVQGGINADELDFSLEQEWLDCDTIYVNFTHETAPDDTMTLEYDGTTMAVPSEMLENIGAMYISLTGYDEGTVRLTTEIMSKPCQVVEAGYIFGVDADSEENDPDIWMQIMETLKDHEERIKALESGGE